MHNIFPSSTTIVTTTTILSVRYITVGCYRLQNTMGSTVVMHLVLCQAKRNTTGMKTTTSGIMMGERPTIERRELLTPHQLALLQRTCNHSPEMRYGGRIWRFPPWISLRILTASPQMVPLQRLREIPNEVQKTSSELLIVQVNLRVVAYTNIDGVLV